MRSVNLKYHICVCSTLKIVGSLALLEPKTTVQQWFIRNARATDVSRYDELINTSEKVNREAKSHKSKLTSGGRLNALLKEASQICSEKTSRLRLRSLIRRLNLTYRKLGFVYNQSEKDFQVDDERALNPPDDALERLIHVVAKLRKGWDIIDFPELIEELLTTHETYIKSELAKSDLKSATRIRAQLQNTQMLRQLIPEVVPTNMIQANQILTEVRQMIWANIAAFNKHLEIWESDPTAASAFRRTCADFALYAMMRQLTHKYGNSVPWGVMMDITPDIHRKLKSLSFEDTHSIITAISESFFDLSEPLNPLLDYSAEPGAYAPDLPNYHESQEVFDLDHFEIKRISQTTFEVLDRRTDDAFVFRVLRRGAYENSWVYSSTPRKEETLLVYNAFPSELGWRYDHCLITKVAPPHHGKHFLSGMFKCQAS